MWLLQFESALNIWASPNKSYHGSFHQLGYQINSKHPLCSVYYSYLILTTFFLCSTDLRKSPHYRQNCETQPPASIGWVALSSVVVVRSFVCPASVTSPLISTIWCFRAYKPYIFCEDMILATCQCQHIFCCWVEPSLLLSSFQYILFQYIFQHKSFSSFGH